MKIGKTKTNSFLLYIIFFLTFFGYYAILLLTINAGMGEITRTITIPIRILIGLLLISIFLINSARYQVIPELYWFILFSFFYLSRIFIDYYLSEPYNRSTSELILYYFSFSIIPFICLGTLPIKQFNLTAVIQALLISGLVFSILAFLVYGDFIGQVGRLSSSSIGEEVLSPLALSYCSTLVIGIGTFYLIYNDPSTWKRAISLTSIILSIVPFFLGASRGALLALFLPFIVLAVAKFNLQTTIKGFFLLAILIFCVIYLDGFLGSGLLRRFSSISSDIESGNSSAARIEIWQASFGQFLNHPIFGDKLRVEYSAGYAHNLFIEVLQTTGILGFIPILILVFRGLSATFFLFKFHTNYAWIGVIFMQSLTKQMFSGAVFNASWLWISLALVLVIERQIKSSNLN